MVGRPESDDERQPEEPITKKRRQDDHLAPLTLIVGLDEPKEKVVEVEVHSEIGEFGGAKVFLGWAESFASSNGCQRAFKNLYSLNVTLVMKFISIVSFLQIL